MNENLNTQMSEQMGQLAESIKAMREKVVSLEGKTDGVTTDGIKKMQKDIADMAVSFQQEQAKVSEMQKAACRPALGAEENSEYSEALMTYLRTGEKMPKELFQSIFPSIAKKMSKTNSGKIIEAQAKALQTGINPDGGYFITPERSSFIVDRIFETSPIRRVANVVTTTGNTVEMIVDDNEAASGGWVQETHTPTATATPQIGLLSIKVHKQEAMPTITQEMIQDAGFDVEGWLSRKLADKLSRTENTAFVTGDGNMKPRGFLTYTAWASAGVYERNKIEQKETASATTIVYDDLIKLQGLLKEAYQTSGTWLMKREVWAEKVLTLNTANNYLFVLNANQPLTLLGKPIILCDDLPGLSSGALVGGTLPIAYGDFGMGYTIVDRLGIEVLRDPFSAKPYIQYYTTKRVGGDVTNYEAIKILKIKS